jgi:hypothetical protein
MSINKLEQKPYKGGSAPVNNQQAKIDEIIDYLNSNPITGENYTKYVALLTQSSTSDPTTVELENNTGLTFTFVREGAGIYTFSDSLLDPAKVAIFPAQADWASVKGSVSISNKLTILTTGYSDSVLYDDVLSSTAIEIRIYN